MRDLVVADSLNVEEGFAAGFVVGYVNNVTG